MSEKTKFNTDALRQGALANLRGKVDFNISAIGAMYNDWDEAFLDAEQKRIDAVREWAIGLEKEPRDIYLDWVEFFQGKLNEARNEVRFHTERNRFKSSHNRLEQELEAAKQAAMSLPKPPK